MAFLRFTRDKRGYEHFYLVEPTTNRRGKVRPRVLYWFRTPPNVKVGRDPFDPSVRREIEAQNPGVQFDWRKIVETPIPSADIERWRERRRAEKAEKAARRAAAQDEAPESDTSDTSDTSEVSEASEVDVEPDDRVETEIDAALSAVPEPSAQAGAETPHRRRRRRGRRPHHDSRAGGEQPPAPPQTSAPEPPVQHAEREPEEG
jgi:hypothetical protein